MTSLLIRTLFALLLSVFAVTAKGDSKSSGNPFTVAACEKRAAIFNRLRGNKVIGNAGGMGNVVIVPITDTPRKNQSDCHILPKRRFLGNPTLSKAIELPFLARVDRERCVAGVLHNILTSGVIYRAWIVSTRIASRFEWKQLGLNESFGFQHAQKDFGGIPIPNIFQPYIGMKEAEGQFSAGSHFLIGVACKPINFHRTAEHYLRSVGDVQLFGRAVIDKYGSDYCRNN